MRKKGDSIELQAVQVSAHIGVPEEERRLPQTLLLDVTLLPRDSFQGVEDDIEKTIDYAKVWERLREVAAERPRKLLETLAEDLCHELFVSFPKVEAMGVRIRKAILPGTKAVAISIWREAPERRSP
ncbi:MAG: dihydroneopterin aldolase [Verrucomicrobiota bacterium]